MRSASGMLPSGVLLLGATTAFAQPAPQAPRALLRTGDASGLAGAALPLGAAGAAMLLAGLSLRRRRR